MDIMNIARMDTGGKSVKEGEDKYYCSLCLWLIGIVVIP